MPQGLPKLIIRLNNVVTKNRSTLLISKLGNEISRRMMKKHSRLSVNNGIYDIQQWANAIKGNPKQISTFIAQPDFAIIPRRDIDIVFHFESKTDEIFSQKTQNTLEIVRYDQRLILENPHLTGFKRTQSWARPTSLTYLRYQDHLPTSGNMLKSHFIDGIDIAALEYALFTNGCGHLQSRDRIFMYGRYNTSIGTLAPNHVLHTDLVKMQCDRVPRNTRGGYCVNLHSYPIDQSQLATDLGNNNPLITTILGRIFQVPV